MENPPKSGHVVSEPKAPIASRADLSLKCRVLLELISNRLAILEAYQDDKKVAPVVRQL